ncbi:serine palmitoyltransferase 2-like [Planococcus citri]|uniref:serine palmitoyltransferase 2-like n=1 Tax=Planococcus citri TaxID=170843 RepID=UPI0031F8AF6C
MADVNKIPYYIRTLMLIGFRILILLGSLNRILFYPKHAGEAYKKKFKGLYDKFDEIYFHYIYRKVCDCSHAPISSGQSSKVTLIERKRKDHGWTFEYTGRHFECINMGSFNYLGLATLPQTKMENIVNSIDQYGVASAVPNHELTKITKLHLQLEKLTSEFLGVESVLLCGAGFATNALNLPAILSKKCIVFSDEKNHASLILGLRTSKTRVFKYFHNDFQDLEIKIVENLKANKKAGGKLFSKIFIICEGIYSMDGTILDLKRMIQLKKKYKAYLFIDDAHGVGMLGPQGKGIFNHCNVDPSDIDILMGTYSKAFASNGGYISGKKNVIDHFRTNTLTNYGSEMSPAVVVQAIHAIETLMHSQTANGNILVDKIKKNTHYMRRNLKQMGLNICGDDESHIIPWILGSISAVSFVIRELKKRGVAAAGVVYPATPLMAARVRFNVSAVHSQEELDHVLKSVKEIVERNGLNYGQLYPSE